IDSRPPAHFNERHAWTTGSSKTRSMPRSCTCSCSSPSRWRRRRTRTGRCSSSAARETSPRPSSSWITSSGSGPSPEDQRRNRMSSIPVRREPGHHRRSVSGSATMLLWLAAAVAGLVGGAAAPLHAQVQTFELDSLLVTGASRLPGGAVGRVITLIDREDMLRRPVASVSEAVAWARGADLRARSPAQGDLSLRGTSCEGVLVLADGVRMSDPQTGHFDLDVTVPLERVERIEVLLGPASAQFGSDAVGGVVNIVTRSEWQGAEFRSEAGTFGRWALAGAGGGRLGGWDVGAGAERTASD